MKPRAPQGRWLHLPEYLLNVLWAISIPTLLLFASKAYYEVLSSKYVYPHDWPIFIAATVLILGTTTVSAHWSFARAPLMHRRTKLMCMSLKRLACIPAGFIAFLTLVFGVSRLDQRDPPLSSTELLIGWLNGLSQFAPMLAIVFASIISMYGKRSGWKLNTVVWSTVAGVTAILGTGTGTAFIIAGHILKSQV
ncbi:hypothetical protein [Renibacterium salmoninarum]|uniref:hypothetical protein n=1 Tax=Renibacterium salmoninarum TaxID=1646 RepID=UPI00059F94CF|nr:hypothetical protein [Renibacterium salmoninarum]